MYYLKVLWRSGVILWLRSQNSQVEWVRYPVGQHLSVMTKDRGLDEVRSISAPPTLGAKKCNFTFTNFTSWLFWPEIREIWRLLWWHSRKWVVFKICPQKCVIFVWTGGFSVTLSIVWKMWFLMLNLWINRFSFQVPISVDIEIKQALPPGS